MKLTLPNLSAFLASLGGAAGITGIICLLVGTTPSSTIGQAVQGAVSGLLVLIASHHATSVVATRAKLVSAAPQTVQVKL
jgi:flavin-binding protein dodecin